MINGQNNKDEDAPEKASNKEGMKPVIVRVEKMDMKVPIKMARRRMGPQERETRKRKERTPPKEIDNEGDASESDIGTERGKETSQIPTGKKRKRKATDDRGVCQDGGSKKGV